MARSGSVEPVWPTVEGARIDEFAAAVSPDQQPAPPPATPPGGGGSPGGDRYDNPGGSGTGGGSGRGRFGNNLPRFQ